MKLSKLKLKNYRCFGSEEQVILIDQLTTFIGNNSTGKTAALSAINCMFSENSNDRILHRSDFHLPQNILPDEMEQQSLYIEAIFEFEELQSGSNGGEYAIPIFFQHFVVDNPGGLPYLRIRLEATWEKSNTIDGSIDSKISYITCPEFAEIEEGNRTNASRRDLDKIRVIYVPAVRDPSKQLKNASGTMMYQIMSSINWSEETKGRVKTKIKELNEQFEGEKGVSMFGTSLGKQWKTYDSDERYSTASLRFNSTDIETSIRKTEVVFEPTETGKEYTIDQMGDGLRSLFYISLVDSILDVEGQMVREIETDPEHIKEAVRAYPELYFAKLVILGEGDSEEIILPKYWEAIHGNTDVSGISIVPLGGRHVNHFWRLLNDLEIPYITLLDLDRERDGGGWGRIQYVLKQLIANGYDRNVLLNTTDSGILTDAEFEGMAGWNVSAITAMQTWIAWLEKYNVFFSAPLDIDFMMLEQMGDMYKATLDTREGPCIDIAQSGKKERITKIENDGEIHSEYETRILKDIKNTLKEEGGDGHTYSPEQQKLMVWYTYFFLNRGKPSTHIAALSQLSDEELKENVPPVLQRLIETADHILKGDKNENCAS